MHVFFHAPLGDGVSLPWYPISLAIKNSLDLHASTYITDRASYYSRYIVIPIVTSNSY